MLRVCLVLSLLAGCAASRPPPEKKGSAFVNPGLVEDLVARFGPEQRARIERGVRQLSALWRPEDGDLGAFAHEQFVASPDELARSVDRLESLFEQSDGHMYEIARAMRWSLDVDIGPVLPVDRLVGGMDPAAHLVEDLFRAKVGFWVLLNLPLPTLAERLRDGPGYDRERWVEARLAGRFSRRVPAEVQQRATEVGSAADLYVSEYNLYVHHLLDSGGRRLFPKGKRLISHWNLRDEIKAAYAEPDGLAKQRLLIAAMDRIVTQTLPAAVVNGARFDWDPRTNALRPAPPESIEADATAGQDSSAAQEREPDTRYRHLLEQFKAARAVDPFTPVSPTALARAFEAAEVPEERVVGMLTQVLASPLVPKIADEIRRRLGRPLEPHDLWFNGFQARGAIPEEKLSETTRQRYPDAGAFARDIPHLLSKLGFPKKRGEEIATRIRVDPSRGAGHAMPALRRGDFPRLRTRIEAGGMDFKGYNVAVHELGHNVEQVVSLYDVDHTLLAGVPNTAFTEALAFVFQARDLELLGYPRPDAEAERLRVLNDFWQTWEIAGVALVDLAVWKWMYAHPEASPAELRKATISAAKDVWNRHYASVLGARDVPLLAIYSHMISYPLYLFNYPLGHLIAFQLEEHFRAVSDRPLGEEFDRIARTGAVTPDVWMTVATGRPLAAEPLLEATARALGGR